MRRSTCPSIPTGGASLRTLAPDARRVAGAFIAWLRQNGVRVTLTSARRSLDTQRKLYQAYLAGCTRYPAAKPGQSMHATGYAFDLQLDPPVYGAAGQAWERAGFTWGGRFGDQIHFDFRPRG